MQTQKELYNRFQMLGRKYQELGYIIKSEEQTVTHEQLDQFENNLNRLLKEMEKMRHFVVAYYQRGDKID